MCAHNHLNPIKLERQLQMRELERMFDEVLFVLYHFHSNTHVVSMMFMKNKISDEPKLKPFHSMISNLHGLIVISFLMLMLVIRLDLIYS